MFVFVFSGENETEQLACMMEVLTMPPSTVLEQATRRRLFFGKHPSDENFVTAFGSLLLFTAVVLTIMMRDN